MPTDPTIIPPGSLWTELGIATAAAGVGTYIRMARDVKPLSLVSFTVACAECIVSGFISYGVGKYLEQHDAVSYAIAGALGLLGTAVIRDTLLKLASRKADTV
jgi:hypothetical protein